MRIRALLATLALLGAACRESPVSPYYTPSGLAPTGLAVSLRTASPSVDPLPAGPAIEAAGDSVLTAAVLSASGCSDYSARAGMTDGVLVVTIVDSLTDRICSLSASSATFRAVVRPAPHGRYDVVLRTRIVPPRRPTVEWVLTRRSVSLP